MSQPYPGLRGSCDACHSTQDAEYRPAKDRILCGRHKDGRQPPLGGYRKPWEPKVEPPLTLF